MSDTEQRVRERAYQLWDAAGRPHDHGDAFWHQASQEIEGAVAPDGDGPDGAVDHPATELSGEDPPEAMTEADAPAQIPPAEAAAAVAAPDMPAAEPEAAEATVPREAPADPKAPVRSVATNTVRKAAATAESASAPQRPHPEAPARQGPNRRK